MYSVPSSDRYFGVLAERYNSEKDSDIPECAASYVFLRSHTLSSPAASIRESLQILCEHIPYGVLDKCRFAHTTSGSWRY